MSISPKEIERLSRMTPSELQVEFGRAYWSSLAPKLSQEPVGDFDSSRKDVIGYFGLRRGKAAEALGTGRPLNEVQARALFKRVWLRSEKALRREICVKLDYCKKRSQYKDETTTAIAIGGVISSALSIPVAIGFILAVYLTRKGLGKFCRCAKSGGLKVGTVG